MRSWRGFIEYVLFFVIPISLIFILAVQITGNCIMHMMKGRVLNVPQYEGVYRI